MKKILMLFIFVPAIGNAASNADYQKNANWFSIKSAEIRRDLQGSDAHNLCAQAAVATAGYFVIDQAKEAGVDLPDSLDVQGLDLPFRSSYGVVLINGRKVGLEIERHGLAGCDGKNAQFL